MYSTKNKTFVKLSKTYRYPNAVLNPSFREDDALQKASNDFISDMKEVLNNYQNPHEILAKLFETEIIQEPEYQRRVPGPEIKDKKHIFKMSRGTLLNMLVNFSLERKYGKPINLEQSPELFEVIPEVKDEEGIVVAEQVVYLKEDVEDYFREQEEYYMWLIQRMEQLNQK